MVEFEICITINKPADIVTKALNNPDNFPYWQTDLEKFEVLKGGPDQVGSIGRLHYSQKGRPYIMEDELIYCDSGKKYISKVTGDVLAATVETTLKPLEDKTEMSLKWSGKGKALPLKLFLPMLRGKIAKRAKEELERFKRLVETRGSDFSQPPGHLSNPAEGRKNHISVPSGGFLSLVLAGFGHVGKAFCALLQEKREILRERYGIGLSLRAVLKSNGGFIAETDLAEHGWPETSAGQTGNQPFWRAGLTVESVLRSVEPGVLVECTPSSLQTGEPGLTHIQTAVTNGWHVVTADKGPLAVAFRSLLKLARENRVSLKFSGATAAALPTLDVGLFSLAGAEIFSIEGILNGTSNFILTRMEEGATYEEAIEEAQAKGIAEHNPALDVEGWDTAAKLLIIANSVLGLELTLEDIRVQGITEISPALVERTRKEGKALKLIGKISRTEGRYRAEVLPLVIETGHPLYYVEGTDKGITFLTDTMGSITITGGKSDPRGAAAALLKDIIHTVALLR